LPAPWKHRFIKDEIKNVTDGVFVEGRKYMGFLEKEEGNICVAV
jgi:hypothetical protein